MKWPSASQRSSCAGLGPVAAWRPAELVGQPAGHRTHPRLVLDGHPHVVEHVAQVGGQLVGADPVLGRPELDVDPGLGSSSPAAASVVVPTHTEDLAQRAGHVPVHPQQRVHQQLDLGLVPVQFGGDRVDEVGHVVGDDVHHQARPAYRVQVGIARLADLHQGPALRPAQAQPRVRLRHRGQPRGQH